MHLMENDVFQDLQSAYRSNQSTEIAVFKVLGSVLFLLYVADLLQLVKLHGIYPHCCADDTQTTPCILQPVRCWHIAKVLSVCTDKFSLGWCPTGCSLCLPRLRCSGVHLLIISVRSRRVLFLLVHICAAGTNSLRPVGLHWCKCHHECSCHCSRQSVFCSTPANTQRASFADTYHLFVSSACTCGHKGGLLQLSSLGYFRCFPDNCYNGCSLCSALPLVSCSRRGSQSTWLHSSMNYIAWKFRREFSSGYPFSCIVALTAWRHHTSLRSPRCRRRFTSTPSECFDVDTGHIIHTMHHAGWLSLPDGCCSSEECSSTICSFCTIAAAVLTWPEDALFQSSYSSL